MNSNKQIDKIEDMVSNNLVKMTNELNLEDENGVYTQFNSLIMETFFLILRRMVITDNHDIDGFKVRMSGRGFNKQPKETREFLENKSSIFALANKKDNDNLRIICKFFEEQNIIKNIVDGSNAPHLFKSINLVEIYDLITSIMNSEHFRVDIFTKLIARNFVLSTLTALSLLHKLFEEKCFNATEMERNNNRSIRKNLENDVIQNQNIANEEVRDFYLNKKTGVLKNPSDGTRNISFKVETFNNIIWTIKNEIKKKIEDENSSSEIIFKAGLSAGLKFGKEFNEHIILKKEVYEPKAIIREWFEFDSDVGFGKFELEKFTTTDVLTSIMEKNKEVGKIKIEHNFLIENKEYTNINSFIKGYIEGVLNGIFIQNELFKDSKLLDKKVSFKIKENIISGSKNTSMFDVYIENLEIDLAPYIIARKEKIDNSKFKEKIENVES